MISAIVNLSIAYSVWWFVTRLSLFGAWFYRHKEPWGFRHWLFSFFAIVPLVFEALSTILCIFALVKGDI